MGSWRDIGTVRIHTEFTPERGYHCIVTFIITFRMIFPFHLPYILKAFITWLAFVSGFTAFFDLFRMRLRKESIFADFSSRHFASSIRKYFELFLSGRLMQKSFITSLSEIDNQESGLAIATVATTTNSRYSLFTCARYHEIHAFITS